MELIGSGAEAEIYLDESNLIVKKIRSPKNYRINFIDDRLRKSRTKREFKIISKLYDKNFHVPKPIRLEKYEIEMSFISGSKLRDVFENNYESYSKDLAKFIAEMHNLDIIHGDLTTSNMIVEDDAICFIDFGLSKVSKRIEDKAVDLHLLKQALESYHYSVFDNAFSIIISEYAKHSVSSDDILSRFDEVEKRGRNKH